METGRALDITFTFLYQRSDRLESYIYKENRGARAFIYDLSDNIDEKSITALDQIISSDIICYAKNNPFNTFCNKNV